MNLSSKSLLPLAISALLTPQLASALTVENGTVYGLPQNTPFVLKLDNGQSTEVVSDAQGQVTLTDQDDDDDNTLFILMGSSGDLINKNTGEIVGELNEGVLTTAGMAVAGTGDCQCEWYFGLRAAQLDFTDLETNTANGAAEALASGFDTVSDADDSAWGGSFTIGYRWGDADNWRSAGSVQWFVEATYAQYEEMEGQITGTQELGSVVSVGQSEVSSLGFRFGPKMYLCDNFAVSGSLGWTWYETEDSGNIRQFSPDGSQNILVGSFAEEEVDGTGTFEIGVSYDLTDRIAAVAGYSWSFEEVGSSKSDQPAVLSVGFEIGF